jgi:glycosyltransferase involved in cell wall biosynthesis
MQPVKFSLLIPTRERAFTLKACLQTVVAQSYENLEIIVSDNFSQDNTRSIIESMGDARIKYVNPGKRVSMSDNWEFGLSHATGDWFSVLGDDDGLLPQCFETINSLIHRTKAKAIRTRASSFVWPEAQRSDDFVPLSVPLGLDWTERRSQVWVQKVLKAHANYSELPMLYNGGFVQTQILRSFIQKHGRLFFSRIPDVYSGMLISHLIDSYIYSYEPVVINGTSAFSTGYAQFKKIHPRPHEVTNAGLEFAKEPNLPFHPSMPLQRNGDIPKSLLALACESYAQVADKLPQVQSLNYAVQLPKIMSASMSMTDLEAQEWVEDYRKQHQLEPSKATATYWRKRWSMFRFMSYRISLAWNTYSLPLNAYAIRNIHEAAIAASVIKVVRPAHRFNSIKHMFLSFIRAR